MKLFRIASLLVAAMFCVSAFAGGPTWNPIPVAPVVNNYYQQQPDYAANVSKGFQQLADSIKEYQATRSSTPPPETTLKPVITYERQPDGSMSKCRTYGENSFCD